jgi:hypothetical protein
MAEQEVIKHTKKIFSVWGDGNNFWHKVREFVLEIVIIVFAVSLSIYLHDRSEKKHQRHEAKEFLLGLKQDLIMDLKEMNEDKLSFTGSGKAFSFIVGQKMNTPLNRDSLNKYMRYMFNTTGLVPNNGRFEGFKSSGKLGTIENTGLQNDIMDLYQENIPTLLLSTNNYSKIKQKLFDYTTENRKRLTDSTNNLHLLLATEQVYNISNSLIFIDEIIERYDLCINKMKEIIAKIDKEYGK